MDWGSPEFVIAIMTIGWAGWLINNNIRAKHGYALEDEWGGKTEKTETGDDQENAKLRDENRALSERLAVLERIITDKNVNRDSMDVAEQIEALRDERDIEIQTQK